MTKNEFKKFMENYPVFLDGATGSNLQKMNSCSRPPDIVPGSA